MISMSRRVAVALGAVCAALALAGTVARCHPSPGAPQNAAAAHAVEVLTGGDPASLAALPPDFAAVMGYQPVLATDADGSRHVINPQGECSASILSSHLQEFDRACKTHDLGEDLLRYAALEHGELGGWARRAIDDRFADDLTALCDGRGAVCHAKARVAEAGVRLNSWRQGEGVAADEDGRPYAAAGVLFLGAVVGPRRRA